MTDSDQAIPATGLIAKLFAEPYRFSFFQAVRLIEMWESSYEPVGYDSAPHHEVVRFSVLSSLDFPASQIYSMTPRGDVEHPARMVVRFFGLNGAVGALPHQYSEIVLERLAKKDRTLQEFLDLFNHRLLSLFYRAWAKYQFWILGERALQQERITRLEGEERYRSFIIDERPKLDPLGQILLCLTGMGIPACRFSLPERDRLAPRTEVADQTWRFYTGLLSHRHRSAIGLEAILSDHFNWPVKVQPLCGRWLQLERADRTRLRRGCNTKLGQETVAGRKVWEVQGKFRLRIGPLSYDQFCSLLPIGAAHRPFAQIARFYAGQHLDFDLDLLLRTAEIPALQCGNRTGIGPRLGWNTWLKTRGFSADAASVKLRPYDDRPE